MCILEKSKVLMYYYCVKCRYGNKSGLLFTDTDSLMYEIKTEDVPADFSNDKEMFNLLIIFLSQNTMMIQTN